MFLIAQFLTKTCIAHKNTLFPIKNAAAFFTKLNFMMRLLLEGSIHYKLSLKQCFLLPISVKKQNKKCLYLFTASKTSKNVNIAVFITVLFHDVRILAQPSLEASVY